MGLPLWIRDELHRYGVHAVAQAGGGGAVVEDVPKVAAAFAAFDFGSGHAVAEVLFFFDSLCGDRLPETGPTGSGFEFRFRSEQLLATAGADECALIVHVQQFASKCFFRTCIAQDIISSRREDLVPLRSRVGDLVLLVAFLRHRSRGDATDRYGRNDDGQKEWQGFHMVANATDDLSSKCHSHLWSFGFEPCRQLDVLRSERQE